MVRYPVAIGFYPGNKIDLKKSIEASFLHKYGPGKLPEKDKEIKLGSPEDKQFQKALEILIQEIESTSKKLIDYPKVLLKIQNFEVVR